MIMQVEEFDRVSDEVSNLMNRLEDQLGLRLGRSGKQKDIDYVSQVMGGHPLYEFEVLLAMALGPVTMRMPLLGFDSALGKDSKWYFEKAMRIYPEWFKLGWLPFASDGSGNYFIFPLTPKFEDPRPILEIVVAESTIEPSRVVGSHLFRFLKNFIGAEFADELGSLETENLVRSDPELRNCAYQSLLCQNSSGPN